MYKYINFNLPQKDKFQQFNVFFLCSLKVDKQINLSFLFADCQQIPYRHCSLFSANKASIEHKCKV